MTRATAPSRLHFGLFALPGANRFPGLDGEPGVPVRRFGGVGLMVERPGVAVVIDAADRWTADGPSADRALGFARSAADALGHAGASPSASSAARRSTSASASARNSAWPRPEQ